MRKIVLFMLLCLSLLTQVFAQTRTVTGRVTDEQGNPLSGATVVAAGGGPSTTTNTLGDFSISLRPTVRQLQISYVGYNSQAVNLGNQKAINVALTSATGSLSEVIVTGLTRVKRTEYAGAATHVSREAVVDKPVGSFD